MKHSHCLTDEIAVREYSLGKFKSRIHRANEPSVWIGTRGHVRVEVITLHFLLFPREVMVSRDVSAHISCTSCVVVGIVLSLS